MSSNLHLQGVCPWEHFDAPVSSLGWLCNRPAGLLVASHAGWRSHCLDDDGILAGQDRSRTPHGLHYPGLFQ